MSLLRHLNPLFILLLALLFIFAGCAKKSSEDVGSSTPSVEIAQPEYPGAVYEAGDSVYPEGYYIHSVSLPDESLSIIAKWFTGDLLNWEVLAKCNPDINPNRIFLGNKIKIPRSIMTRQDPMTAEFVTESQPEPKHKKAPSVAKNKQPKEETRPPVVQDESKPEETDEPILFGPKGYSKE